MFLRLDVIDVLSKINAAVDESGRVDEEDADYIFRIMSEISDLLWLHTTKSHVPRGLA